MTREVGGLAKSFLDRRDFNWDLGSRVLHSHFKTLDEAIKDSGVHMRVPERIGWVVSCGEWHQAPIQHHVDRLPERLRAGVPAANLTEYYRSQFGYAPHRAFIKPFTEKMWATSLTMIDHEWTLHRGGPSLSNVPAIQVRDRGQLTRHPTASFPYPEGGAGRLRSAVAEGLDPRRLCYGVTVESSDVGHRAAHLSNGETVVHDQCVTNSGGVRR